MSHGQVTSWTRGIVAACLLFWGDEYGGRDVFVLDNGGVCARSHPSHPIPSRPYTGEGQFVGRVGDLKEECQMRLGGQTFGSMKYVIHGGRYLMCHLCKPRCGGRAASQHGPQASTIVSFRSGILVLDLLNLHVSAEFWWIPLDDLLVHLSTDLGVIAWTGVLHL